MLIDILIVFGLSVVGIAIIALVMPWVFVILDRYYESYVNFVLDRFGR